MRFNNLYAVLLTLLIFGFVFAGAALNWDNQLVNIALGVLLAKLSDVVQFYFRRKPPAGRAKR